MEKDKNGRKIVLVACGTGIATSTVVAERVKKLIEENGLNAEVIQCKMAEVASKENEAHLLVTTSILPKTYSIPVVNAMGYLTGMGSENIDKEVIKYLKE
ncbi:MULTISPECIES: PTS sugar transporter subunit IIB [Thermoanaerobacter]|jgi:PTS system galactitol-specific IIB component|uniref:Phosphotransferase system, galactitol-specific IIB component n=1 Tax=Thermoanaerobacter siderophilus SR4 TaxID=880478 RepID=I9KTU7_9THEO|nr:MULTISPECIES: PTS sugar transporter subunit IIB [Thermoanaerobacter]EIW00394.1 phosphotransferase system, galactitol-specific IIB component [Thermoanaerobacter siderophilus SR4]UZQ83182.1 PTS sugar transporter subunit IIB [Thermoanaerobacter sp. RKWS2]